MSTQAEPILECKASLGEGALWDRRSGHFYWVDILERKVHVFDPRSGENKTHEVGEMVGTVVVRASGGLLLALVSGMATLDLESGSVEYVLKVEHEREDLRFNDGKCDPAGRLWVGTMALDPADGPEAASLFVVEPNLEIRKVLGGVTVSNGIVWSSDRKTMYYIDTLLEEVTAFDYDLDSGTIDNRRTAVKIDPEYGLPDGMAIDSRDRLWVAMWGGGRILHLDPEKGEIVDHLMVEGAKNTTACAFGGENLDELYITTAANGTDGDPEQPLAGALFRAKMDTPGVPSFEFAG